MTDFHRVHCLPTPWRQQMEMEERHAGRGVGLDELLLLNPLRRERAFTTVARLDEAITRRREELRYGG